MTKRTSPPFYTLLCIGREKGKISLHLVLNLVDIAHLGEEIDKD